uniref:Uncharacterized protein LOC114331530 n=1 Tax=Diabrotica virgifera virgifera TaxID=50390 RepID=A0A6P7FL47_DIAVI
MPNLIIKEVNKQYFNEMKEIVKENELIKEENKILKNHINMINNRLDKLENKERRNNIVIQGLNVKTDEHSILKEEMKTFLDNELGVQVTVAHAKKLGSKTCLIKLSNESEKYNVMKNKIKLRGYRQGKIYINEDMSKKERDIQGQIRIKAKEERSKGKKVKVRFQKMIIDNEEWIWDNDADKLIPEISNKYPGTIHPKN